MNSREIVAMSGGHKIIADTTERETYSFYGFIPHEDTKFTSLYIGDEDVADTAATYLAGIYYGAPRTLAPGYYRKFELASGIVTLVLTLDSVPQY